MNFGFLELITKYKKVKTTENRKWHSAKRLKYIEALCDAIGI